MKYLKMSKFFTMVLILAFTFPQWAAAQHKGEARMEKMQTELDLSDQQVADIKSIHEKYRGEMKNLRSSENPDKKTIQNLRTKKEAAILDLLTEEQAALYQTKKASKGKANRGKRAHSEQKKALKAELKAYNAQEVKPVLLQKRNEFEAKLSDEDKAEIADLRAAFKSLKKGPHKKMDRGNRSEGLQKDQKLAGAKKKGGKKHKGFKKAMAENPELEQRTMALLNKHSKALKKVDRQLAPLKKQWEADKQNILAKHLAPAMLEKMAAKKAEKDAGKKEAFGKIHFLLMDPAK